MKTIEVNINGKIIEMQVPEGMSDSQISKEVDNIAREIGGQQPDQNPDQVSNADFSKLSQAEKMQLIRQEQGANPRSLTQIPGAGAIPAALETSAQGYEMAGDLVNEQLSKRGVNPYVSAAISTPISKANEFVGAAAGLAHVGKGVAREIAKGGVKAPFQSLLQDTKALGQGLKDLSLKAINAFKGQAKTGYEAMNVKQLKQEAEAVKNAWQESMKYKQTDWKLRPTEIKEELQSAKAVAGKAINKYEQSIPGYKFKGDMELTGNTVNKIKQLKNIPPKELAAKYSETQLQRMYDEAKTLERSLPKSSLDKSVIMDAKTNITDAQELLRPGIKGPRTSFAEASNKARNYQKTVKQEEIMWNKRIHEAKARLQAINEVLAKKQTSLLQKGKQLVKDHPVIATGLAGWGGHKISQFLR